MLQAAAQNAAATNISGISREPFMSGKSSPTAKAPQAPRKSCPSPPMFQSPILSGIAAASPTRSRSPVRVSMYSKPAGCPNVPFQMPSKNWLGSAAETSRAKAVERTTPMTTEPIR